jgi:hypothetical protein
MGINGYLLQPHAVQPNVLYYVLCWQQALLRPDVLSPHCGICMDNFVLCPSCGLTLRWMQ